MPHINVDLFWVVWCFITGLVCWWDGYRNGKRRGLRQPLTDRERALAADVRRRHNGQGVALVRLRSSVHSRPERLAIRRRKWRR